jgi:hypothetical protein
MLEELSHATMQCIPSLEVDKSEGLPLAAKVTEESTLHTPSVQVSGTTALLPYTVFKHRALPIVAAPIDKDIKLLLVGGATIKVPSVQVPAENVN